MKEEILQQITESPIDYSIDLLSWNTSIELSERDTDQSFQPLY